MGVMRPAVRHRPSMNENSIWLCKRCRDLLYASPFLCVQIENFNLVCVPRRRGVPEDEPIPQFQQERRLSTEPEQMLPAPRWNLATRIAFRFCFAFFSLFILTFPAGTFIPFTNFIATGVGRFWNAVVPWVGTHILHIGYPILLDETGSGDRT